MMRRFLCGWGGALLLIAMTGCGGKSAPSATPLPTPGVPMTITDSTVTTQSFRLEYPDGWRVITSAAAAPPALVLVAPGDCQIVWVSSVPMATPALPPTCDRGAAQMIVRTVALDTERISVWGGAGADDLAAFTVNFDRIVGSVSAP